MAGNVRESKTVLTAEDRTAGAFASMQRSLAAARSSVESLQGAYAALAGGAVIGGFAAMIKQSLDFAEGMNKMSQKTGIAVEQLSALAYAAKLADVSQETLGKGIKNLNEYMVAANNPTSQQARLLKELGVNIKGDTLTAMQQLAKMYEILPDGATKSALSTEIFKKAGQDMIPFLNQGAESMRKMMEEARRLGLVISTETAKQAEQFNDNIKTLQASTGRLGIVIVNEFAPALVKASEAMKEALLESGKLKAAWVGLGAVGAAIFTDDGLSAQQKVNREIKMLQERLAALNQEKLDGGSTLAIIANLGREGALDSLNNQIAVATKRLNELQGGQAAEEQARKAAAARAKEEADRKEAEGKAAEERLRAKLAQQQVADEVAKYNERMRQLDIKGWVEYAEKIFKEAEEFDTAMAKIHEERNKAEEKYTEEQMRAIDALAQEQAKVLDGLREQIEARQLEIDTFGMSKQASLEYAAGLLEARAAALSLDEATEAQIASLKAQAQLMRDLAGREGSLEAMQQQAKANEDAFKSVFGMLEGGFRAALTGAKSFGDYLKNGLKNALYELVARPFIINIAASLTGASSQVITGALGNAVGTGGFGSLFSGSGMLGSLGALGSAFGNGMTFGSSAGLGATFANLGAGGGSLGFQAGSVLGAAGPYVAAALAAYQIFQRFADKGENPKYRLGFGSAAQGYASDSIFGRQGFVYAQGNDAANQGFRAFQQGLGGLDTQLARLLTPEQIAAATGRLNGAQGREFSFPKGDPTASEQLSLEYLKIKYSAVFADFNSQISSTIANFSGKSEDLIKYIGEQVAAYDQLRQMMGAITDEIDGLGRDGLGALSATLDKLRTDIEAAQQAVRDAGEDPTKQLAAQQALIQAIRNRYQTESQLIAQITDQLQAAQQGRFEFAQGMASRLAGVGAPQDRTMAIMQRYQQLQSNISGTSDPTRRIGLINQAVSVIDAFVQNGRDNINRQYEALNRQQQEQIALQSQVFDQRREQLQKELDAFSAMASVADQVRSAIKSIQYSSANPMSAFGRFDVMGQDIGQLQGLFRSSTGSTRAGYASQLVTAIQGRLSAAQDLYQRPSDEYLNAYNEAMRALSEVQSAAEDDARQAIKLQEQIEALNREQAALQTTLVDYSAQQAAELTSLNEVAAMYYKILAEQGDAAYAAQIDTANRQLNMMVTQAELLSQIRALLQEVLTPSPTGQLNGQFKGAAAPIVIDLQAGGLPLGQFVINTIAGNATSVRRSLALS